MKPPEKLTKEARELKLAIVKQIVTLSTSAFGLIAALAWNETIKEIINTYVKPYLPQGSTIISLLVYTLIVTILAVVITLNLSRLQNKLEEKNSSS